MSLVMRLGICFLLSINLVMSRDYSQGIDMMKGGKMVLNWEVEEDVFFFKLSGQTKGFVGLAFASDGDPDDGFIAGVDEQGQGYIVDLHLDHINSFEDIFHFLRDNETNINLEKATEEDSRTVIEGFRSLDNCGDRSEDMALRSDLLKVFYIIGEEDVPLDFQSLHVDLKKPSQYGYTFLTLFTNVQTNFQSLEKDYRSSNFKIDSVRPKAKGDAKCKVHKGKSSAKFYTGFLPILKGYNGENGLIRHIEVYQCDPANSDKVSEFTSDTHDCYSEDYPPYSLCKSLLFMWSPGSGGEVIGDGGVPALLDSDKKHYLLVSVVYNAGTGFLSDNSGVELFYTREEMKPVSKVVVGHRQSNKLLVLPGLRVSGLCSSKCLSGVTKLAISSISLHAGQRGVGARFLVGTNTVATGYRPDYQPVRQLITPYMVHTSKEEMAVECLYRDQEEKIVRGVLGEEDSEECFAVITTTTKVDIVECVSEPDRNTIEQSYGLEFVKTNANDEELIATWNNKSESEKKEINAKAYNETLAIFCIKEDLTKITESGIKAPGLHEEQARNDCSTVLSVVDILDDEELVRSGPVPTGDTTLETHIDILEASDVEENHRTEKNMKDIELNITHSNYTPDNSTETTEAMHSETTTNNDDISKSPTENDNGTEEERVGIQHEVSVEEGFILQEVGIPEPEHDFDGIESEKGNGTLEDIFELIDQDYEFQNNNSKLLSGRAEAISNGDINFNEIYKSGGLKLPILNTFYKILITALIIFM